MEETVDVDWRGGYRSQTSHYYSHNPGDNDILLRVYLGYRHVNDRLHNEVRGDSRGQDERR